MRDYQIKTSKNKEINGIDIAIEGHLNVSNIVAIQKEINAALKNCKNLNLQITHVDDADITIVQLIVALKQKCKESNIDLSINFNLKNETSELLTKAGLTNLIN
jgi:ABC-type transporter Mla MlaB component